MIHSLVTSVPREFKSQKTIWQEQQDIREVISVKRFLIFVMQHDKRQLPEDCLISKFCHSRGNKWVEGIRKVVCNIMTLETNDSKIFVP